MQVLENFFINSHHLLKEYEYTPLDKYNINFTQNPLFPGISFLKQEGSGVYLVNVINLDGIGYDSFINSISLVSERTQNNLSETRNKFMIYILITTDKNINKESIFSHAQSYSSQPIYSVFWIYTVDKDTGKYTFNCDKKQPTKLLNLRAIMKKSFSTSINIGAAKTEVDKTAKKQNFTESTKKIKAVVEYKTPLVTYGIIMILALVWLYLEFQGGSTDIFVLHKYGALSRDSVFLSGEYYRLFSSIFIHIGFAHFFLNSFSLYIFGSRLENILGKFLTICVFLLSGIVGNVLTIFAIYELSAGASGGIFGIIGACLAYTVKSKKSLDGLNYYSIAMITIINVVSGFIIPGVNNYAHVAGLLTGFLLGLLHFPKSSNI